MEEKQALLRVSGVCRRAEYAGGRRYRWVLFMLLFVPAALFWVRPFAACSLTRPRTPEHRSESRNHCMQVKPMVPSNESSELVAMESYLLTEKFRNESIVRLSGAVQIPSVSFDDMGPIGEDKRWNIFYEVERYLERAFPLLHQHLQKEVVNEHGLVYTWHGSDSSLKPTLLMAHQDVVPVPKDTISAWTHPPFSGFYDGRYVWGRGSSDCKNTLIAAMEAVEILLKAKFEPHRSVVLSFGFDEEVSGFEGARHLSRFLLERYGNDGVALILDEGAGIFKDYFGATFATPGVAEKGYVDVDIVVRMPGGHSSIPPPHTGIGVMSELITLVEGHPYAPVLDANNPFLGLMKCGAEYAPKFPKKLKKLLPEHSNHLSDVSGHSKPKKHRRDKLAEEASKLSPSIKYLMTTSVAVDLISGGAKVNALPERTLATVNHRINIGSSSAVVEARLTKLAASVADKYNLTLHAFPNEGDTETPRSITLRVRRTALEPAPVTPTFVDGLTPYAVLAGTTRALYGTEVIMAPGIMTGNTDTRHYWDLTRHIFRYVPGWDREEETGIGNIHTVDERISVTAHVNNVRWYSLFIRNMDEVDLG